MLRASHDRTAPFPWRRLLRIAAIGMGCALLVGLAGSLWQRVVFGANNDEARMRVESEVRAAFDAMARRLRDMSGPLTDPAVVRAAAQDDTVAARRLFIAADDAIAADEGVDAALTVYGANGRPIAWAGRPSELSAERLAGNESWFFAQGPLGLRLVYARPVDEAGLRLGIVAAERPLGTSGNIADTPDSFRFVTRLGAVSIQLPTSGEPASPRREAFDVAAPSGERLLAARIEDGELALTRERWQRATWSFVLLALGLTMLVMTRLVVNWRSEVRRVADYRTTVLLAAAMIVLARFIFRAASPADWSDATIFSAAEYASTLLP